MEFELTPDEAPAEMSHEEATAWARGANLVIRTVLRSDQVDYPIMAEYLKRELQRG